MKSIKIFYIKELCMNLPDDFTGNTLDALKLLVKIREEAEAIASVASKIKDKEINNMTLLWNDDKNKCYMDRSILEWNDKTEEWTYR